MRLRQKQIFYHSLAQLLRSGMTFPQALEKLRPTAGSAQQFIEDLIRELGNGKTAAEAFESQGSRVSLLEKSVISAVEKSGQLDRGLQQLADYFGTVARARSTVLGKIAYPLFILHFGVFVLAAPVYFTSGVKDYLRETLGALGSLYLLVGVVAILWPWCREAAAKNALLDRWFVSVPFLGKIRRAFALSRFFSVYDLQLDAGVNVIDALLSAAKVSRSGLVISAVQQSIPELRNGSAVGPLLARSSAFPPDVMQGFLVAEETGGLDRELKRLTQELHGEALRTLETFTEWLPKLIYTGIVLYLGWKIVTTYQGFMGQYQKALDF